MRLRTSDAGGRLTTGAYILHAGWEKWRRGTEEQAVRVHGMAAGAYPFLQRVPPTTFLRGLAAAEIGIGAALLVPAVPDRFAGAGLTALAGGLVGMYARTPSMRRAGSIWPGPTGSAVSKDVWMLAIGSRLLRTPR